VLFDHINGMSEGFVQLVDSLEGAQSEEVHTSSLNVFNSSWYTNCHIRSISSQSVTMPCSSG